MTTLHLHTNLTLTCWHSLQRNKKHFSHDQSLSTVIARTRAASLKIPEWQELSALHSHSCSSNKLFPQSLLTGITHTRAASLTIPEWQELSALHSCPSNKLFPQSLLTGITCTRVASPSVPVVPDTNITRGVYFKRRFWSSSVFVLPMWPRVSELAGATGEQAIHEQKLDEQPE